MSLKKKLPLALLLSAVVALAVLGPIYRSATMNTIGWLGIPRALWYIFVIWIVAILFAYFLTRKTKS